VSERRPSASRVVWGFIIQTANDLAGDGSFGSFSPTHEGQIFHLRVVDARRAGVASPR
jgi:hypothetical protein